MTRAARASLLAFAVWAAAAAPASAAVDFGSTDLSQPLGADRCSSYPCSLVDEVHADGTTDAGAPIAGVLTSVRLRYGGDGAVAAVRVLRPGGSGAFLNVGPEIAATLPDTSGAERVLSFDVRRAIQAGDRLGLGADSSFAGDAYLAAGAPRECLGAGGSHPAGATVAYTSAPCGAHELLLQGTVEPDADGDGYGDDSQDGCSSDPAIHDGPCSADLGVTESVDRPRVTLSGRLIYTTWVVNRGTSPARNVGLRVLVGDSARLLSWTTTRGRCGGVLGVFCWLGTMPSGSAVRVTVTLRPGTPGPLAIGSTVSSGTSDPDATDNYDSAAATVVDPFAGVRLPPQTVTVERGTAPVLHSCPRRTPRYCQGAVSLAREATVPGLGQARFQLQPGVATRVPIHLTRRGLRLLERRGRLVTVATTRAVDGAGTRRVSQARVVLVAPRKSKRPR